MPAALAAAPMISVPSRVRARQARMNGAEGNCFSRECAVGGESTETAGAEAETDPTAPAIVRAVAGK